MYERARANTLTRLGASAFAQRCMYRNACATSKVEDNALLVLNEESMRQRTMAGSKLWHHAACS